jgi:type II restriction/modification system DNA methylase subunit YeeA
MLCLLNFFTTQILTSKICIIECISRIIEVIDYNNARWKPEINQIRGAHIDAADGFLLRFMSPYELV